jgi:hypothetical protein
MRKNKAKKPAKQSALPTPPSSNPLLPSQTTKSDPANATEDKPGFHNRSAVPIIRGIKGVSNNADLRISEKQESGQRKKRKLKDGEPVTSSSAATLERKVDGKTGRRADLERLYEPWLLIPAALRSALTDSSASCEDSVVPVVFTHNQNVKAGINKLKLYVSTVQNVNATVKEKLQAERLPKGNTIIAVSAQGKATTKLVGTVEIAKRVVGPSENEPDAESITWYTYTSLSSQAVERKRKAENEPRAEHGRDDEDAFESLLDIKKQDSEKSRLKVTVPVLTVWISNTRIPRFRDAFGEQTFQVARTKEDK